MLEKIFKKDKNEELELILEEKNIDEKTKNFLLGILYKIEVSYKDYKIAKAIRTTKEEYIEELLNNIKEKCNQIKIVELNDNGLETKIQKKLQKEQIYIDKDGIISYPIEKKILYAIQKQSNEVNDTTISNLITKGKNIDRTEVIRDFNGWSWTTINTEIEDIKANLVYQTLQILLGAKFLSNMTSTNNDKPEYLKVINKSMNERYGEEIAKKLTDKLEKISIISEGNNNPKFKKMIKEQLTNIEQQIEEYKDTKANIDNITKMKKESIKELEKATRDKNEKRKNELIKQIDKYNYLLNPENYIKERDKIIRQKDLIEVIEYDKKQQDKIFIEFIEIFFKCLNILIENETEEEKVLRRIYQLRYFLLLPFDRNKNINQIKQLEEVINQIERDIIKNAIDKKVLNNLPFEILKNIFETRIIELKNLYVQIIKEDEKYYMQVFDENITDGKIPIEEIDKIKINKKIKIFI